jgi:proteasome assembly chaperone (PAC2) family protein
MINDYVNIELAAGLLNAKQLQLNTNQINNDIDWNVLENPSQYLLKDDSIWINKNNKEFYWNINKLTDLIIITRDNNNNNNNSHFKIPRKIFSTSALSNNDRSFGKIITNNQGL